MNPLPQSLPPRRGAAAIARRNEILTAVDNSGLSGAPFVRRHQISYTAFCNGHQQRAKPKSVDFAARLLKALQDSC